MKLDESYFKWSEFCAWEGERWNFYFPLNNNFEALIWLTKISALANQAFERIKNATPLPQYQNQFAKSPKIFAASKYHIDFKLYSFSEAELLCSKSTTGYLNSQVFKNARLNASSLQKKVLWKYEKLEQDPLYKGKILNFINKRSIRAVEQKG